MSIKLKQLGGDFLAALRAFAGLLLFLGVVVLLAGVYTEARESISYCDEKSVAYETQYEQSSLVPEGDRPTVQDGDDGTEKLCYNSSDELLSREVTTPPVAEVIVVGVGSIPDGASSDFVDADYADDWQMHGGNFSRNFTKEVLEAYYAEQAEEEETYYAPTYYTGGGAICRDGTRSYSTGRGTCSWHGGVAQWL